MLMFRLERSLQKFVPIHVSVHNHFNHQRHLSSRDNYKIKREAALVEWQHINAILRRVPIRLTAPRRRFHVCGVIRAELRRQMQPVFF
jgi:hypothetical protein